MPRAALAQRCTVPPASRARAPRHRHPGQRGVAQPRCPAGRGCGSVRGRRCRARPVACRRPLHRTIPGRRGDRSGTELRPVDVPGAPAPRDAVSPRLCATVPRARPGPRVGGMRVARRSVAGDGTAFRGRCALPPECRQVSRHSRGSAAGVAGVRAAQCPSRPRVRPRPGEAGLGAGAESPRHARHAAGGTHPGTDAGERRAGCPGGRA